MCFNFLQFIMFFICIFFSNQVSIQQKTSEQVCVCQQVFGGSDGPNEYNPKVDTVRKRQRTYVPAEVQIPGEKQHTTFIINK